MDRGEGWGGEGLIVNQSSWFGDRRRAGWKWRCASVRNVPRDEEDRGR